MKTRWAALLFVLFTSSFGLLNLRAEPSDPFIIKFPLSDSLIIPNWMTDPTINGDQLRISIFPENAGAALCLTACFTEQPGTPIQVKWVDSTGFVTLVCDDLGEGISMPNQRSILIGPKTLGTGGTLVITGESLLTRLKLEWLQNGSALLGQGQPQMLVAPADQPPVSADSVSGETVPLQQNAWNKGVVKTTLISAPERADSPIIYPLSLDTIPRQARLDLKVNGLAAGQHLVVWLNNSRAAIVMPAASDLTDLGYSVDNLDSSTSFVGWREGSVLIDRTFFKLGENDVQFSAEDDSQMAGKSDEDALASTPNHAPFSIRDAAIQFRFPSLPQPLAAPMISKELEPISANSPSITTPPIEENDPTSPGANGVPTHSQDPDPSN